MIRGQNPENIKLYHGSAIKLKPEDLILPITKQSNPTPSNFGQTGSPDMAYATDNQLQALYFAYLAAQNQLNRSEQAQAYLYEVSPVGKYKVRKLKTTPPAPDHQYEKEYLTKTGFVVKSLLKQKTATKQNTKKSARHFWEDLS